MVNIGQKKKKRTYIRKRYSKSAKSIATTALKLVKKSMNKVEVKNTDFSSNFTQGTTPIISPLHLITQGTSSVQRIGNKISAAGLSFRFYAYKHPSSIVNNIRVVIVQDTQQISDASTVSWLSVFSQTNVVALRNLDTERHRFKILFDKSYQFSASTVGKPTTQHWIPIKTPLYYNGSANSDIQKNGIYVLTYGDDNTNQAAIYYYARIYFTDS